MATVLDYIDSCNANFLEKEFNEIDNLIFSRFSYIKLDGILSFNEKLTVKELYEKYIASTSLLCDKETLAFFSKIAKCKRYSSLSISNYISILNDSLEKQFCAVTIYLPNNTIYIAFRGTDTTLIGLKEDFNMTYMPYIPSQFDAVKYLEDVASLNNYKIIVGGHSKGGNLAMYAASFCNEKYRDRIVSVYNNDGPGFFDEILESKEYQSMLDRIYTFVPESSIIGMLLNHKEKYFVVKSKKTLIMQHNVLSWQVHNDELVKISSVNKKSKYIDEVMTGLLIISKEEKKKFFDIIYQVLVSTGATTIEELSNAKIKNIKGILDNYKKLSDDEKTVFIKMWKEIIKMAKSNIVNYLPKIKKEKITNK